MYSETQRAREMLAADFKGIVDDAEELLRVTAGEAGEKADEVRERIRQRIQLVKSEFNRIETAAARRIRATDGYAHAHPWTTAGVAAGAALLIGMLISRR